MRKLCDPGSSDEMTTRPSEQSGARQLGFEKPYHQVMWSEPLRGYSEDQVARLTHPRQSCLLEDVRAGHDAIRVLMRENMHSRTWWNCKSPLMIRRNNMQLRHAEPC